MAHWMGAYCRRAVLSRVVIEQGGLPMHGAPLSYGSSYCCVRRRYTGCMVTTRWQGPAAAPSPGRKGQGSTAGVNSVGAEQGEKERAKNQTLIRHTPIFLPMANILAHSPGDSSELIPRGSSQSVSSCLVQVAQGMAALHGSSPLIMHRGEEEAGVGLTAVFSSFRRLCSALHLLTRGRR